MAKKKLSEKEKLAQEKAELAKKEQELLNQDIQAASKEINEILQKYNLGIGTRITMDRPQNPTT